MSVVDLGAHGAHRHALGNLQDIDRATWALHDLLHRASGLRQAVADLVDSQCDTSDRSLEGLQAVLDELDRILKEARATSAALMAATGSDQRPGLTLLSE